jgi:hypothetical protein
MSEFSDASDNIKEMPEMQEFLDNMETEVTNHYVILNKSETQSHIPDPKVLKLELKVVIKSSSFDDITLKNVLLDTGCTKTSIKANRLPANISKCIENQTRYRGQQIQGILSQNMTSHSPFH